MAAPARKTLRTLALKTNRIWPFSRLNRLPYHMALKAFIALVGGFMEVKAVYLRHSMADGSWVAGLSDIDFTVVLDDGTPTEAEYAFHRDFFRRYRALSALFIMLGEVEVMTERQLHLWQRFGYRGRRAGDWALLHGIESREPPRPGSLVGPAREGLDEAFTLYEGYYLPKAESEGSASLGVTRIGRRMCSILGVTDGSGSHSEVLSAFDRACRGYVGSVGQKRPFSGFSIGFERLPQCSLEGGLRGYLAANKGAVRDVVCVPNESGSGEHHFVIVDEAVSPDCFGSALRSFPSGSKVLMTEPMLAYAIGFMRPVDSFLLRERGSCLSGDIRRYCADEPSEEDVRYRVMFDAVRASVLFRSNVGGQDVADDPGYLLRYIVARRFLESGSYEAEDGFRLLRERYPQIDGRVAAIFRPGLRSSPQRYALTREVVHGVLESIRDMLPSG